jgi:signal transduction histidine kinase
VLCRYTKSVENKVEKFKVTYEVADKGIGITESDQLNIFKPFFKSTDPISQQYNAKSHGLGLNICQQIAHCLGGQITFNSKQGKGSQFRFTFDAQENEVQRNAVSRKVSKSKVVVSNCRGKTF